MRRLFLTLILLLALTSQGWTATNYYVSTSGSNNNRGTSPDQPWASLSKVNKHDAFLPGDQVLFKRGDTWREVSGTIPANGKSCLLYFKGSGTAANPITVGAYGSGSNPVFLGSWNIAKGATWSSGGGTNKYRITNPNGAITTRAGWRGTTDPVVIDTTGPSAGNGYGLLRCLPRRATTLSKDRDFYQSGPYLYTYCSTNPSNFAWEFALASYGIVLDGNTYVNIQDIDVKCVNMWPIAVMDFNGKRPYHNRVYRCGAYASGGSGIVTPGSFNTFDSCNVYSNCDTGIYLIAWHNDLTGEKAATDCVVKNCTVKYNGIYLGYDAPDSDFGGIGVQANRCIIINNVIQANGPAVGEGKSGDGGISVWAANNTYVAYNQVIDSARQAIEFSDHDNSYNNTITYNLIVGVNLVGDIYPFAIHIDNTGNNPTRWNYRVFNNTIIDKSNRGIIAILLNLNSSSDYDYGTQIKNNIFYSLSAKSIFLYTRYDNHKHTTGMLIPWTSDYNCAYTPHASGWIYYAETSYTLAGWRASGKPSGTNGNQDVHSINSNPNFVNASGDFTLVTDAMLNQKTSPCLKAGTSVNLLNDLFGKAVHNPPNMGVDDTQ